MYSTGTEETQALLSSVALLNTNNSTDIKANHIQIEMFFVLHF